MHIDLTLSSSDDEDDRLKQATKVPPTETLQADAKQRCNSTGQDKDHMCLALDLSPSQTENGHQLQQTRKKVLARCSAHQSNDNDASDDDILDFMKDQHREQQGRNKRVKLADNQQGTHTGDVVTNPIQSPDPGSPDKQAAVTPSSHMHPRRSRANILTSHSPQSCDSPASQSPQRQQQAPDRCRHSDGDDAENVGSQPEGEDINGCQANDDSIQGAATDKTKWDRLVSAAGQAEEDKARDEGASEKEVTRRRKAAEKEAIKIVKAREKEQKKAQTAAQRAAKKASDASAKAAGKASKEVQRALSGGPVDPTKQMVLRLSPRLLELPWANTLLSVLCNEKYTYMVDASMPLSDTYALVRWARRVPREAAAALLRQQQADCSQEAPALEAAPSQNSETNTVDLLFPMIMVFLTPQQIVKACCPNSLLPTQAHNAATQHVHNGQSAAATGFSNGNTNTNSGMLGSIRVDMARHFSSCTLMVGCVGLSKELTAMEQAPGSVFNRQVVRDQLLDMQLAFPSIRLREDLLDGAQASEVLVTTTRCLGLHHKKQQEGYLESFSKSKVGNGLGANLGSTGGAVALSAAQRVCAAALSHLLPPAKAVNVACTYPSLVPLLEALNDQTKNVKVREGLLMSTCGGQGAAVIGKQSARNVYDFFTQHDPSATCKPDTS